MEMKRPEQSSSCSAYVNQTDRSCIDWASASLEDWCAVCDVILIDIAFVSY